MVILCVSCHRPCRSSGRADPNCGVDVVQTRPKMGAQRANSAPPPRFRSSNAANRELCNDSSQLQQRLNWENSCGARSGESWAGSSLAAFIKASRGNESGTNGRVSLRKVASKSECSPPPFALNY